jgi:hypothetical protein
MEISIFDFAYPRKGEAYCAVFSAISIAQSDLGSIGGFVRDPSGGVVPKATVIIRNEATGEEHPETTNASGYYTVTKLARSFSTVTVEVPGFKKHENTHDKLDPNTALSLDPAVTIGSPSETVEVTATAAVLQTESSATGFSFPGSGGSPEVRASV